MYLFHYFEFIKNKILKGHQRGRNFHLYTEHTVYAINSVVEKEIYVYILSQ